MSNNPPEVTVGLTKFQAEFLLSNCDSNIEMGLNSLSAGMSRDTTVKLVALVQAFKGVKAAVEKGMADA